MLAGFEVDEEEEEDEIKEAQEKQERMLAAGLLGSDKGDSRAGELKAAAQHDAEAKQKAQDEHNRSARPPWFSQRTLSAEIAEDTSAFR